MNFAPQNNPLYIGGICTTKIKKIHTC